MILNHVCLKRDTGNLYGLKNPVITAKLSEMLILKTY